MALSLLDHTQVRDCLGGGLRGVLILRLGLGLDREFSVCVHRSQLAEWIEVNQRENTRDRTTDLQHPKLEQHVVDFTRLPSLPAIDDVFIALGTTIKVAGSQDAFRAIDFDAVLAVARAGIAAGATKLGAVSALGASPKSSVFYSRVKGEAEQALAQCGYKSLVLARPAMLAGDRESLGQPVRSGERVGLVLTRALRPLIPANYRSIAAADVAAAMVQAVCAGTPGVRTLESGTMQGASGKA